MKQAEQFVQALILLTTLTAISFFRTHYPYVLILICGIFMILFAIRSLEDKHQSIISVLQILISVIYVIISGCTFAYLIFYECRINKMVQFALPPLAYFFIQTLVNKIALPLILINILFILMLLICFSLIEQFLFYYISAKNQMARAVKVTAVNEMYEKKLNHELVMKNYLADKNARLEERENISRNIHNNVGHSITAAIMTLDAADLLFDTDKDKAREKINTANERIRESLNSVRHAVRVLDYANELISVADFIDEINAVANSFVMDTLIKIHTDFSLVAPDLLIPHEHAEFLTGAAKELLSNGVRHGGADMFLISMTADSRHIKLCVSDNGNSNFTQENSLEKIKNGFGLKKIIAYAKKCGGLAAFENENGFKSAITLPLYGEDGHE